MLLELVALMTAMTNAMQQSYGLVLDGFLGIDDPLLVEDPVAAIGALDRVVRFQLGLLPAL